jgi:hypothetical protein
MERAELIAKIEGVRRVMADHGFISLNFKRNAIAQETGAIYESAVGKRGFVANMSGTSFQLAVDNTANTSEEIADRLIEALELYDDR